MPKYICECCDFTSTKKNLYDEHMTSDKHMLKEIAINFFKFARNKIDRDIERMFFKNIIGITISEDKTVKSFSEIPDELIHEACKDSSVNTCDFCNKTYSSKKNLLRHKQNCKNKTNKTTLINKPDKKDTIFIYNTQNNPTCTIEGIEYKVHRIIEVIQPINIENLVDSVSS